MKQNSAIFKKIFILVAFSFLSACAVFGWFEDPTSYYISYYGGQSKLVSSEYITENSKSKGEILTAYRGYTVIDKKMYIKERYVSELFRANSDVAMTGTGIPIKFSRGETKQAIGDITLSDGVYALVAADYQGYFALIGPRGELHNQIGKIKNDRLKLLPSKYYISNQNFSFDLVENSSVTQSAPTKGFDVKYSGMALDKMIFTYFDYSTADKKAGYFEDITFPASQDIIKIEDFAIKVIRADEHKLEYMILD